jgi:hypothetical protein
LLATYRSDEFGETRRRGPRSASCAAPSPFHRSHGIEVERLMTDNGSAYRWAYVAI